ncbi:MAG TPA: transcriptional repressor [Phycisphaerae bacterium]|nr:transcriptional repressor [Phycisphaerae bacterium]
MESAEVVFRNFLRSRRLKYTSERKAILEAVERFNHPFEAEELLRSMLPAHHASKATVYRTLKHLAACHLVNQIFFDSGKQSYYDYVGGGREHDHLIDEETKMVIPFSSPEITALGRQIARKLGFTAVAHRFLILGRKDHKPPSESE